MAANPFGYYRDRQTVNAAVHAYRRLVEDSSMPIETQVEVVKGYLDAQRAARFSVPDVREERPDMTLTEFLVAEDLWWFMDRTDDPPESDLSKRVMVVKDRLSKAVTDPRARRTDDDNSQLIQAQYLLKSAGLVGHGVGQTAAGRLPNNDTDLPLAVAADQLGAVGLLAICSALYVLVVVGIAASVRARTPVETMLAVTAAAHFAAYGLINLAGTVGLPTSGVPFPFVSRGNSSLIMNMVMLGIIVVISAWPGGQPAADLPNRSRALVIPRPKSIWPAPIPLTMIFVSAFFVSFATLLRPIFDPVGKEPAWAPPHPREPRDAMPAARILLRSDIGDVVIASRRASGEREYPVARSSSSGDPHNLARSLASLLGAPVGGPVEGIERLYRQRKFGACSKEPCDVVLTIDPSLQASIREALIEIARERTSQPEPRAAAIAIETDTGAIRALVSLPEPDMDILLDNSRLQEIVYAERIRGDERAPLLNRALRGAYVPGSVAKLISLGCDIDSGVVTKSTVFQDDGDINDGLNGARIQHNNVPSWLAGTKDTWTVGEAFGWSLNGWFARAGQALGPGRFLACLDRLGVITASSTAPASDARLPLNVPHTVARLARDSLGEPQSRAEAAYGQGKWVMSPIHLALLTASIARDGNIPTAYIVDGLRGADGSFTPSRPPVAVSWRQGWSSSTTAFLAEALTQSATPGHGWAGMTAPQLLHALGDRPTGAKTGTAERGFDAAGHARPYHSWATALGPISAARALVVTVIIEGGGEGSLGALKVIEKALLTGVANSLLDRPVGGSR